VDGLVEATITYGTMFAPRSACTFTDLAPYVELVLPRDTAGDDNAARVSPARRKLLEWLREFGTSPRSADAKIRRRELRTYIFSTQLMYKLVASSSSDVRQLWIPAWVDILSVWKSFQAYDQVSDENMVRCIERLSLLMYIVDETQVLTYRRLLHTAYAERESPGRRTDLVGSPAADPYGGCLARN
jgi:hypothetical protein